MRDLRLYDVLLAIRWDIEGFLEELLDLFDLGESPSIGHDCLLSIVSESNEHHPREEQKFKVQFSRPKKPLRKIRKFEFSLDNFFWLGTDLSDLCWLWISSICSFQGIMSIEWQFDISNSISVVVWFVKCRTIVLGLLSSTSHALKSTDQECNKQQAQRWK